MSDTHLQGYIRFQDGGFAHIFNLAAGAVFVDLTESEAMIRTVGGSYESLWKANMGRVIEEIALQLADGSVLTTAKILSPDGGAVGYWRGSERNLGAEKTDIFNLRAEGLSIPIVKGMVIRLLTAD